MGKFLCAVKCQINKILNKNYPIILGYHSIHNDELPFPIWTHLRSTQFEEHLKFLSNSFRCISLSTLSEHIQRGKFEPYSVVVTFDDGYRNNYTNAFPLLMKYKIPATIFITTNLTDTDQFIWSDKIAAVLTVTEAETVSADGTRLPISTAEEKALAYRHIVNNLKKHTPRRIVEHINVLMNRLNVSEADLKSPHLQSCFGHLTWGEIKTMLASGLIEIGSHGKSHSILSRLSPFEARNEIVQSQAVLDANLGNFGPVKFFAYPNGEPTDYTHNTHKTLKTAGFQAVLTTSPKRICKSSDRYELPRICIGNQCDLNAFRYIMSH